ncbi:MAG: ATP-binding protein [Clostridia bacterium]|nr:ATP-binding protein [Clostridia bacterium]
MSFSKHVINKINEEFESKRQRNEDLRDTRLAEVYSKLPEIKTIDKELSQTGMSIMSCALAGKDGLDERIKNLRERNLELQRERAIMLASRGFDESYTDLHYDCELCQDYGVHNGKLCSCYKNRLIEEQFKLSGISNLIKTQSFEAFSLDLYENKEEMGQLLDYATNYVRDFATVKDNILFVGGTGLGKTHLSTAIAKSLIEKGYNVIYETAQNIFFDFDNDHFRDRFGDGEPVSQKYLDCDLLIIDDLGAEAVNSFTVAYLYNIINTRLNKNLPIIASTNLNSKEIRSKYHDRITSRLFGEFNIKLFTGNDLRKLQK